MPPIPPQQKPAGHPALAGPGFRSAPATPPTLMGVHGTRPGRGMDPMAAMLGGIGQPPPMPAPPQGPPLGGDGLPFGGSMPTPSDPDSDLGDSPLLQALAGSLAGPNPSDPYGVTPTGPGSAFEGIGAGDPNMGLEQLLSLLALGKMGVGGPGQGPGPGSSGVEPDPTDIGQMMGF